MAEFIVRLGTPAGEIVTRTVEALAAHEARARLEREGFKVFAVTPPKAEGVASLTRMGGLGGRARVKANDFLLFNQQLAALLRAGIPILQAITMLRRRAASVRLRAVLEEVEEAIRGGAALSQGFAAQGATFPRIYTASILAGERSGALDDVLSRYVNYMRRSVGLRRKIRGALAYPAFLLFACFGLVIDRAMLKLPLAGKLLVQMTASQAARSLATLLAGGITIVESWEIAAESITNLELRQRSSAILPLIREGRSFTESLETAKWMPDLAIDMIGIGERSGSLREMLDEVATFYEAESEVRLEQLTTTLEPAILVVMGGVVVIILLAIYLPIIQSISNGPQMH